MTTPAWDKMKALVKELLEESNPVLQVPPDEVTFDPIVIQEEEPSLSQESARTTLTQSIFSEKGTVAETEDEYIGETGQAIRCQGFLEFGACSTRSAEDYDA